jgi:hypothetical protein
MQQDNNIKNKLQQLENQQLPDLSHMDEHWQQMQATLAPGSTGGKVISMNRWLWSITGIVLIATAIVITTHFLNKNNDKKIAAENIQPNRNTNKKIIAANVIQMPSGNSVSTNALMAEKTSPVTKRISVAKTTKNNPVQSDIIPPAKSDSNASTIKAIQPDRQLLLNNLLTEQEKKSQEFVIDNSRDTLLIGEEGSSLFIPSNTLGGSNEVKISLKEFYKQSDIILNKLSTTSNDNQLVTGGMVRITATVNGQPVNIQPNKAIRLYMPDTSSEMQHMQLFEGEEKQSPQNNRGKDISAKPMEVNWIPRNQYFNKLRTVTEVRVLDLRNEPWTVLEDAKGSTGCFIIADDAKLSRNNLRSVLKRKYGYYKIKFRNSWHRYNVMLGERPYKVVGGIGAPYTAVTTYSNRPIGDSVWMDKATADEYSLEITATRTYQVNNISRSSDNTIDSLLSYRNNTRSQNITKQNVFEKLKDKYYIDINSLGWINCDHFLNRTKLVEYAVNLKDSAANYYTMLVFTNIKSMMTGYLSGNNVVFSNVPEGEPVKIVSIGINKNGQPVMAIKETTISKKEESDLQFEEVASGNIKSSLSQMDK